jgi:hypothetical protein
MAAKLIRLTQKNSDTTASSGRELYHLQFSLQAAGPETFGYTLYYDGRWIEVAQDSVKWRDLVLTVLNLRVRHHRVSLINRVS